MVCVVTLKVFLPSAYKFGMAYTLVYRYFCIYSDQARFQTELAFLKRILHKHGYPENVFDKCFKKYLDEIPYLEKTYQQ